VHLFTGAETVGIEIQPRLASAARDAATRLGLPRVATFDGDAAEDPAPLARGTVFFLYCPFGGARLARVLAHLASIARVRPIRVACVDLPLPPSPWLAPITESGDLAVYASRP
jgi:hypothetical protein